MKVALKTLVALTLAPILALLTTSPALAAPPELSWKVLQVGVLPIVHVSVTGEDLFSERPETSRLRATAARWHKGLEQVLEGRDQVKVSVLAELKARLKRAGDFVRTAELAEERYAMGLERWRALNAAEALTQLDRARQLYLEAFTDILDPRALADVELHRALTLLDLDQQAQAYLAFAQMLVRDPGRRFERGYYGASIESAMVNARREITEAPDPIALLWPTDRLLALGRRLALDVFAVGVITGEGASAAITIAFFDVRVGGFAFRERFPLSDEAFLGDDLDRLVSAWHTCALEAPQTFVRPRGASRWFVEFGYTHFAWIQHRRTRDVLHGPAFQLGVTYLPTPGLEVWAKTSQRVTLTDSKGDLLDVFTTSHLGLGVGLTVGDDVWRFSVRSGLEVALSLAGITMTTDVDCKFFGPESDRCRTLFRADSPAIWLGLDFSMSLRVAPSRSWHLGLTAGATSYALSESIVGELNFPLYGTFGFGLPF
jgi:hypothetical protein